MQTVYTRPGTLIESGSGLNPFVQGLSQTACFSTFRPQREYMETVEYPDTTGVQIQGPAV